MIFLLFAAANHKVTDSPKSASSPRGSINPKPSAPKSAPLVKSTTPKQTKKPEVVDHSKSPGIFYFFIILFTICNVFCYDKRNL